MDFQSLAGNMVQHYVLSIIIQVLRPKSCLRSSVSPNFSSFANLHSLSLARPTKKIQIAVTDSVSVVNFRVVRGELSIETDAASIAHQDVKCRGCGETIKSDSNFCRHCGMPNKAGFCMSFLAPCCYFPLISWFPCYSFDIKTVDYLTGIGYPIQKDAVYQYIILVYQ